MSEDLAPFFDLSLELLCIAGIDGRFRRINPAFETLLGYSSEELLSRPFFDFMFHEDREPAMAKLMNLRRGESAINFENRVVCKDGSIRCLAWTAAPATAEGLIYAAARDITKAKAAEEALRRSEQMMRDFIMAISHELRTPMTSMRGSLGLLASGVMGELNDEAARAVSVAERNSVRLASVIDHILELEKRP